MRALSQIPALGDRFTGYLDSAIVRGVGGSRALELKGWLLHPVERIVGLRLGVNPTQLVMAIQHERSDVGLMLRDLSHARTAGYAVILPPPVTSDPIEIFFEATLETGRLLKASFIVQPTIETPVEEPVLAPSAASPYASDEHYWSLARINRALIRSFLDSDDRVQFWRASEPLISVVIVLYNRAEMTYACLSSLRDQWRQDMEIIIVDNGSTDETGELLDRVDGALTLRNGSNLHFVRGANLGASHARGEYILFLNNDTRAFSGAIEAAVKVFAEEAKVGAVGAKLLRPDSRLQEAGSVVHRDGSTAGRGRGEDPYDVQYDVRADVDYCSGAFLLTPRKLFYSSGMFDERYAPAYYEDADYCLKLKEGGYRIIYEPKAVLLHAENSSATDHSQAESLMRRNREAFVSSHREYLDGADRIAGEGRVEKTEAALVVGTSSERILFIDDFIPVREQGQGSPRAALIFSNLLSFGYDVTVLALKEQAPFQRWMNPSIPSSVRVLTQGDCPDIRRFMEEEHGHFDSFFISRPHNLELFQNLRRAIPELNRARRVIYDAEAVFALRHIRERELLSGIPFTEEEKWEVISRELEFSRNVDVVLTVNETEAEYYRRFGCRSVHVLGYGIAPQATDQSFDERVGLLTVGPILNDESPNADAAGWFVKQVLPSIVARLGPQHGRFSLVGKCRSTDLSRLACDIFELAGAVPNVVPFYGSHKVFVAPTRFSAGIPLKVIDAAAHGIPVVASPLVASQLGWEDGKELLVGYTADDFASQCVKLYTNYRIWNQIREGALRRITREFSAAEFSDRLRSLLE